MEGTVVKVVTNVGNQIIRIVDYPEGTRAELIDYENMITITGGNSPLSINEQVKLLYQHARRENRRGEL